MKKKLLAIFLAVAMMFALVIPAMAWVAPSIPVPDDSFDRSATYTCTGGQDLYVEGAYIPDINTGEVDTNYWVSNYHVTASNGDFDGTSYLSFCSSAASHSLGDSYVDMTAKFDEQFPGVKAQLIDAFDYIAAEFGSLDEWLENSPWGTFDNDLFDEGVFTIPTKYIAQIVNWKLLADGLGLDADNIKAVYQYAYQSVYDKINELVGEVVTAVLSGDYNNQGMVTDLVFLASENYDKDIYESYANFQPQIVPIIKDGGFSGRLNIEKTVRGFAIYEWTVDNYTGDFDELEADISFKLFKVNADNSLSFVVDGALVLLGSMIDFGEIKDLEPGYYAVIEYLGDVAQTVFEYDYIDVDGFGVVGPRMFYIGEAFGGVYTVSGGFDSNALYSLDGRGNIYVLGDATLNANGNVQDIYVKAIDVDGAEWLASFCANAGSVSFGDVYKVANELADPVALANAEAALNYIYNKYGSVDSYGGWGNNNQWDAFHAALDAYAAGDEDAYIALMSQQTRLLSQIAIWQFFCGHDLTDTIEYYPDNNSLPWEYQIAIDDVLENGLTGSGALKLAYLVHPDSMDEVVNKSTCQPQLVPYFGGSFDNEPRDGGWNGTIWVGGDITALEKYQTQTHKLNTNSMTGTLVTYVGTPLDAKGKEIDKKANGGVNSYGDWIDNTGGGFTAILLNKGVERTGFDVSNSGHGNPKFQEDTAKKTDKIGVQFDAVYNDDGTITITFEEKFLSASVAIGVYNNPGEIEKINWAPGQYNVTKGHMNLTSNEYTFAVPASVTGEKVYLALHFSGITWYKDLANKCIKDKTSAVMEEEVEADLSDLVIKAEIVHNGVVIDRRTADILGNSFVVDFFDLELPADTYTVILYVDGAEYARDNNVVVVDNDVADVEFSVYFYINDGAVTKTVTYCPCGCVNCDWID